jgi:hypothetical protein
LGSICKGSGKREVVIRDKEVQKINKKLIIGNKRKKSERNNQRKVWLPNEREKE